MALYDVKMPIVNISKRYTFVVGEDRRILRVDSGGDAIDASSAIAVCSLRRPAKPPADGGQPDST